MKKLASLTLASILGCPGTLENNLNYSPEREPNYINTAADSNHKIGTSDPGKIEIIEV